MQKEKGISSTRCFFNLRKISDEPYLFMKKAVVKSLSRETIEWLCELARHML